LFFFWFFLLICPLSPGFFPTLGYIFLSVSLCPASGFLSIPPLRGCLLPSFYKARGRSAL
jgi:hypothetical protein